MDSVAIAGLGYLGFPLAQVLYHEGRSVAAIKHRLNSDTICLPIALDAADLRQAQAFAAPFWQQHWADKPIWYWLIPPSKLGDTFLPALAQWIKLAERFQVAHIVYGSSIGVYSSARQDMDETTPPVPERASAKQTLAAEKLLQKSAIPHITLLRLGGLYSSERHPIYRLQEKAVSELNDGHYYANMLHQDRAVAALAAAASEPQGHHIRNIVETPHPTKQAFYQAQAQLLGIAAPEYSGPSQMPTGRRIFSRYTQAT